MLFSLGCKVDLPLMASAGDDLAVVAGGSIGERRNEETYSKCAAGARIKTGSEQKAKTASLNIKEKQGRQDRFS